MVTYDQYSQPDFFYEPGNGVEAASGARRLRFPRLPWNKTIQDGSDNFESGTADRATFKSLFSNRRKK
jgi:xylose isomerase